ncbi:MAG: hypothetical protein LBB43_05120 [Spirochaetaceae bacterium]|jgi:hypothetical protein|nr:hypothetical protein [Spirochaetaceae bacterium]
MIPREDFIWTIGYDGAAAVVDGQAKRRYGSLSTVQLAEKGLFRAAYAAAVYSRAPQDMLAVVEAYNKAAGTTYTVSSPLERLFGVFPVDVKRTILL